jgi:hypothetical protein
MTIECTEHEYELYDNERIDRSNIAVYYSCLVCGKEKEYVIEDRIKDDED